MRRTRLILLYSIFLVPIVYYFTKATNATVYTAPIHFPDTIFRSGDIIFRDGRGAISTIFRKMSLTDQSYSHAGIIHKEDGQTYVYHVIGGEGTGSIMRKDRLSDFCGIDEAYSFGIYRSNLSGFSIDSLAQYYYSKHIKFDDKFDLATDDRMYCTELVYKILTRVSAVDNFLPLTTLKNVTYCSCDNIFLSTQLNKIFSYTYK